MAKYLTDLADVLRKAGLDVVEMPGWKTRGRPGDFDPKGVLCHHTAGPGDGYNDAWYMAATGRADLSAPLSQLALSRKGVWYVLAAGRANHAGRCKAIGGLHPYPGETYGDGNAQMIGVEAQNRGTDAEDWSPAQYGSYVRGVAALKKHYGWSIVFGHKETSTSGKVDPDFPMDKFRRDVAATTPTTAAPQEDDTMSAADVTELKGYLRALLVDGYTANGVDYPGIAKVDIENQKRITALRGEVAGLGATVAAMAAAAPGQALTAEQITEASRAGAAAALDEKIADATTVLGVKS